MNRVIYVETSIPSFYFETRLAVPENQARRNWTRRWWDEARIIDTLVTSQVVNAELNDTPEPKRSDCLTLLADIPLLKRESWPSYPPTLQIRRETAECPHSSFSAASHPVLAPH